MKRLLDFDPLSGPKPYVVLFIGVNGSGKTTTLGKIAADLTNRGAKVLIVAGDTFRAAAVEQLCAALAARLPVGPNNGNRTGMLVGELEVCWQDCAHIGHVSEVFNGQ